jgi:hypothetical protein
MFEQYASLILPRTAQLVRYLSEGLRSFVGWKREGQRYGATMSPYRRHEETNSDSPPDDSLGDAALLAFLLAFMAILVAISLGVELAI